MVQKQSAISAVIRTWNSERTLRKVLASLGMQNPAIDECIVVDSGSTDSTLEIASEFHARVIEYPRGEVFNYSRALNIGIAEARNERILILSSHVELLNPDVVRLMSGCLDEYDAVGAYCVFRMVDEKESSDRIITPINSDNFDGHNGLWNPCAMITKSAWAVHPFSEGIPRAEDQEWALWHYRHTKKPTVRIRNAGVLYLNPRSRRKEALDYAVIAHELMPASASWGSIARLGVKAVAAGLRGRADESCIYALCAWETGRAHFSKKHWHARAHIARRVDRRAGAGKA